MKRIIITALLLLALALTSNVKAQNDYDTAIGFRLGYYNGLTLKHFVSGAGAVEGILFTRAYYGWTLGVLYEHHTPFFDVKQMNWYFGGGAYAGFYDTHTTIGLVGDLGLEYTFKSAPFCISLDWQPYIPVINPHKYNGFIGDGGALSIRYTF